MYKIIVDGETISNSEVDESITLNPVITLEANKASSFSFTLLPDHPYYKAIKKRHSIVDVYRNGKLKFHGICISSKEDLFKRNAVQCVGILDALNDSIQRQKKYTNMNVYGLLSAYIDVHNSQVEPIKQFEVGTVTVSATESILRYTNMQNTMQEIQEDFIDNYGGYIRTRYENGKNYIDYLQDSPKVASQVIELGKNLMDYNSNLDSTNIATRIIPLGATLEEAVIEGLDAHVDITSVNDGLDYVEASADIIDNYGYITKVVNWDDVTVPSILKRKAEEYLSDVQFEDITIECSALDLSYISDEFQEFDLLDKVHIISEPHGMNKYFTLTKMVINLNEPSKDIFSFGKTEKMSLASRSNKANSQILKQVTKIQPSSIIEQAQKQASSMIAGAEGGNVIIESGEDGKPWRILIMDTDDAETAENVIQLNKNGIGFSNSGVNGFYQNAWTIDGVLNADFVRTGDLVGVNISNGDGTFSVDENGYMKAERGSIGMWNIATEGGDKGALYADNGDYRIWLHNGGATDGNNRVVISVQKKEDDGRYHYKFYVTDEGLMHIWNHMGFFDENGANTIQILPESSSIILRDSDNNIFLTLAKLTTGGYVDFKDNHWVGRASGGTTIQGGGYRFTVQDDGNMVLRNPYGNVIWSSGTAGK